MSRDNDQKGKNLLIWKCHVTVTKKEAYISNEKQLQNLSVTFIQKKQITTFSYQHSISSTHGLQHYCFLGQANLHRLCGLWHCQDRFGQISWSKNDFNNLDVKLKVFKKDDNKEVRLVQNPTTGEAVFNQLMRLRNQLVNAAKNFGREQNFDPSIDTYNVQRHEWRIQTG